MAVPSRARKPTRPEPIRPADEAPHEARVLRAKRVGDQLLRERRGVHGVLVLAEQDAPLEDVLDLLVPAVGRQGGGVLGGRVALDGARHRDHDAHAEGRELHAQGPRVGVHGRLAGAVDGAEEVRRDGRQGRDVDDQALGGDQLVDEDLDHRHDGKDVCLESGAHIGQ